MLPIPRWKDGLLWIFGLLLVAAFLGVFAPKDEVQAQVGPPNQILCNNFANFTGTGAAATVITGVAGKTIYLCGWHITSTSSTTTTFQITAGTTATCGTNTVTVTPALNVTITAPSADHIEFATLSFPSSPNVLNVCVNAPATVNGGLWSGVY